MRIVFAADVLESSDDWPLLTRLLYKVDDGWHVWAVEDPESIEESAWFRNRAQDTFLDELLQKSTVKSAWTPESFLHSRSIVVSRVEESDELILEPSKAVLFLETPLVIVVEDRESDGLFLKTIIRAIAPCDVVDLCERQPSPLKVESPGGITKFRRHIRSDLIRAQRHGLPLRLFVLFDSDAKAPGQPSAEAKRLIEFCESRKLNFHMLQKRAMENYVPQALLEKWASMPEKRRYRTTIEALSDLTSIQRDHLPKAGLKKNQYDETLFDNVDESEAKLLQWFPRRVKPFEEALEEFGSTVTASALRDRCGPRGSDARRELDQLVQSIGELL